MFETLSNHPAIFGILFVLCVVALGSLFVWTAEASPLAPYFQQRAGIVAAYANVPAVLFGLIMAFTFQDIWSRHVRAETAVAREADAVRLIHTATRGLGDSGAEFGRLTVNYVTAATQDDWRDPGRSDDADKLLHQMLHQSLFGPVAQASPQVQRVIVDAVAEIRASRRDRLAVSTPQNTFVKLVAAFALGVLTQFALALVHLGKPKTSRLAVTLFSVAMSFIVWVALVRVDVFAGRNAITLEPIAAAARPPG